ncbi:hypothetical protein [uncultured Agrobacterium sp.]|uniref:hypothetical protein n=1 Tax=uncultured Agrobacterium sp. TaxID=157277 RepID=UPI0025E3061C|nr:hypothetical protein [uncultured Agrobacterium sp.]
MKRIFFAALCTTVVAALVTGQFDWDPARFSASPGRVVGEWVGTVLPTFAAGSIVGSIVYWVRRRSSNPWKGALAAVITCVILEALSIMAG